MAEIRPSGMREIMVEIPSVRWGDIGGYDRIKQQLIEAVEYDLFIHFVDSFFMQYLFVSFLILS
jgi:SpoVK/Ycf46/Vps4 family AAA+-type ATPase